MPTGLFASAGVDLRANRSNATLSRYIEEPFCGCRDSIRKCNISFRYLESLFVNSVPCEPPSLVFSNALLRHVSIAIVLSVSINYAIEIRRVVSQFLVPAPSPPAAPDSCDAVWWFWPAIS